MAGMLLALLVPQVAKKSTILATVLSNPVPTAGAVSGRRAAERHRRPRQPSRRARDTNGTDPDHVRVRAVADRAANEGHLELPRRVGLRGRVERHGAAAEHDDVAWWTERMSRVSVPGVVTVETRPAPRMRIALPGSEK